MKRSNRKRSLANEEASRIINDRLPFVITEAYKTIRTNMMFAFGTAQKNGARVVVITSAIPGEGKSTTCTNLAISFAQMGARVLLIDSDLRKPRLHHYLGKKNEFGLSEVLANMKTIDEVVTHIDKYELDCVFAGQIPPNPSELLSSEQMAKIIESSKEKYDYIFLDAPPLNIVSDTVLTAKNADGVILVAREKYTRYDMLDKAVNALKFAGIKIFGIIVNDVEIKKNIGKPAGYGGYGYGYNYSYGYDYTYGDKKKE